MQSKELLKMALQSSQMMVTGLAQDMRDAPLTRPTSQGGNHPLWIMGHLAVTEGNLFWEMMQGKPHPLPEWKEIFGAKTEPSADTGKYPSYDEVLQKFNSLREQTLQLLDSLSEDDLDQPIENVPEQFKPLFGTYRKVFLMGALHPMHHRGQIADCRRAAGRKPMII